MVSSSDELAVAPEHDFLLRFLDRYGHRDFGERANLEQFVSDLFALKATCYWKIEPAALLDSLTAARPARYADVVRGTYEHFATQCNGARRWGAKVPYFALHLDLLRSMFPDVQVIHVVRDGRDVLASMRERTRHGARHFPVDARFAALRWKQLVLRGSLGGTLLPPGHYLELRYEDLVTDVEPVVRDLERFLGCSLAGAVEGHFQHALGGAIVHSEQIERYLQPGIQHGSMARWRHELSARDVRWFEAIAGDVLRDKHYLTSSPGSPFGLKLLGGLVAAAYAMYRRLPRSLKPTVRQHVS